MAQTAPAPVALARVQAHIEGEISGQVAVGDRNVQIGSIHGGVVTVNVGDRPRAQPRARPVRVLPRPFPGLLDREDALGAAQAALEASQPVNIYGPAGIGKTSLLNHLAHHPPASTYPDGIVHLSGRQPLEDLQQSLYDAFYVTDVPAKASEAEIRHTLQAIRALVVLDDVSLSRDEAGALLDSAPQCGFVLAAAERQLWGQGRALPLKGLPLDDALALVERELGRPLSEEECTNAEALCTALDGLPLPILQAVAETQESGRSLAEAARQLQTAGSANGGPAEALTEQILASLSEAERQVVTALAAMRGAPINADHLSALTQLAEAMPVLEALQKRGLAQAHSPRYTLTGALAQAVAERWDLSAVQEQALGYFADWAEGEQPARLLEDVEAPIEMLRWAVEGSRWKESLRLGRALEGALGLGRRWGAWLQVLQWMLQAARALGDQAAIAYTLHQLGTRALCLGDMVPAHANLQEALQIRRSLGDPAGADVTRYHLDQFWGAPVGAAMEGAGAVAATETAAALVVPLAVKILAIVLTFVLATTGAVAAYRAWFRSTPAAQPTSTPVPTSTPMAMPTHTWTPTGTATHTATPTASFTPTAAPTHTATSTAAPTASFTPTASPTHTATSTPTATHTVQIQPVSTVVTRPLATFTPTPGGPLSIQAVLTDRRCLSPARWAATFQIKVQGGIGQYTYYRDNERIQGPTADASIFYEQGFSTDGPAVGTFFVESGPERAETKFFERPPSCATPTPPATATPTAPPTPTLTRTPLPTPTFTPTPDVAGPSIGALSIAPEVVPGESVYAQDALTVQCVVVDPSGVQQVLLRYWWKPSSGEAEEQVVVMTPADNQFAGSFGPLDQAGVLRYRVEARDKAGNVSVSPTELRDVVDVVDL